MYFSVEPVLAEDARQREGEAMFRFSVVRKLGFVAVVALILVGGTLFAQSSEECNCCSGGNGLGCDCQPCENVICALDPFCCNTDWDDQCNGSAAELCPCCTDGCVDDGSPPCNCCSGGGPLGCNCQPCEDLVCAVDPFCCDTTWDSICDGEAATLCTCCTDGCDNGGGEVCDPVTDGDDVPAISNRGIGVAILLLLGASTAVLLWRRRSAT